MKWTRRRVGIGAAVVLALVATAVAIAAGGNPPDTDGVAAEVVYTDVQVKHRECEGVDGPYAEEFIRATGTSTGDPRLSGKYQIRIYLLVNLSNGVGIDEGTFTIRDPDTGRLKAAGKLKDAGEDLEITQGVLFGRIFNEGVGPDEETQGKGRIIANFRTTFGPEGITTQIGGVTTDGRLPAVVWRGHCTGPYERFGGEIGGGEASATAATASRGLSPWSRLVAR